MTRRRIVFARLLACAVLPIAAGSLRRTAPTPSPAKPDQRRPRSLRPLGLQFALMRSSRASTATPYHAARHVRSSGNFAPRSNRAPFELFLSADEAYVDRLTARGLTQGKGLSMVSGASCCSCRTDRRSSGPGLRNLAARLASASLDGCHRQSGACAVRACRRAGAAFARCMGSRAAETAARRKRRQAAQFASSGNADAHHRVLARARAALRERGTFALLPDTLHAPLRQRMVLLQRASPGAESFYDYLRSRRAARY